MPNSSPSEYILRMITFLLWLLVLIAGFMAEATYFLLREVSGVVTQTALVNNYYLISLGIALYMGFFTYQRCREARLTASLAQAKALQVASLALLAFLPLGPIEIAQLLHHPVPFYRNLLIAMVVLKIAAWLYLLSVLVRYYFFSGLEVYRRMFAAFPSAYQEQKELGRQQDRGKPSKEREAEPLDSADARDV